MLYIFVINSLQGRFLPSDGPEPGDVRLTSTDDGRVDVFISNSWQPVANSTGSWQLPNSIVVCRELGYPKNGQCTILYFSFTFCS